MAGDRRFGWIFIGLVVATAIALAYAAYIGELPVVLVPSILLFEILCFTFLLLFLEVMGKGETIGIESRWGGLGRGAAGWRISRPAIYLACTLVFAGGFAVTMSGVVEVLAKA